MSIWPARNAAQLLRQSVQAPKRFPAWLPGIIGPVINGRTGLLAEIPPINWAGTVLSQPLSISIYWSNKEVEQKGRTTYHDASIHWLCFDHLFSVHAHQIPQEHARWMGK
jgi:hypothetical protein